jgi:hypothetical protein
MIVSRPRQAIPLEGTPVSFWRGMLVDEAVTVAARSWAKR